MRSWAPRVSLLVAGVVLTSPAILRGAQDSRCVGGTAAARLDHVVIAVRDLAAASREFQERLGFSLKPGRVHDNGLRNVHVRFADGTALELISTGEGTADDLSAAYDRFLAGGDGGAFVALDAGPVDSVLSRLGRLAESVHVVRGRALEWVSFPEDHPLRPVFFVHVRSRRPDSPEQLAHGNGATGIAEVRVESSDPEGLADLLVRFGAYPCEGGDGSAGRPGTRYGLAEGSLSVVPVPATGGRDRVLSVTMETRSSPPAAVARGMRLEWKVSGT